MSRLVPVPFLLAVVLALACDSSTPGPGQVRVANLIPDAPSAIDVCLKPDSVAAFGTPLVGGGGLSYPQLSTRSGFDAGTYSVRLIAAGTTCSNPLSGLGDVSTSIVADNPQTLVIGGRFTGTGSPSLSLNVLSDRIAPSASGSVLLRAMNAALGSNPQDVGVVSSSSPGAIFSPFATGVAFGSVSDYAQISGITPGSPTVTAPLASRDTGNGPVWAQGTFNNLADTGVYTVFVIGIPGQSGTPRPSMLLCADGSVNCSQNP
jgi:hypothetical protein